MARAQPVPSFSAPWGAARRGKAQRPFERVAEPMGGRKQSPGCPAVRGRLRRQAYIFDHSCASLWWPGRRGGSASAVCRMA
jgi:hypothetical protein